MAPSAAHSSKFSVQRYEVTDVGCQILEILTFPCHFLPFIPGFIGSKTLILEEEEAYFQVTGSCCNVNTRRPYGELGSVDRIHCLCCTGIKSDLVCVFPGWGCQHEQVSEIVKELKVRMKQRGDTGQIQKLELTLEQVRALRQEMGDLKSDIK